MATLNTLRNKGGIILIVLIGLALLSFVIQDAFFSNPSQGDSTIGRISGDKVSVHEYQNALNRMNRIYPMLTGVANPNEEQNQQLMNQAWDQVVRQRAFIPSVAGLGLTVSEEEMIEMVSGAYISPIIMQTFADPRTGYFSPEYLSNFIAQMNQDDPQGDMRLLWNYLQDEAAAQSLIYKFRSLVSGAAYVTGFEAKQMAAYAGNNYDVRYLVQRYDAIADSTVAVTDAEMRSYYDNYKYAFRQEAAREVEYVTFEALPSAADYAEAEKTVMQLAGELETAASVQQFMVANSPVSSTPFDSRYYNEGQLSGTLGTFAFAETPDKVWGPYFDADQWTMARISDIAVLPDSIELSQIVLPATETTVADSLAKSLEGKGMAEFTTAAASFSQDPQAAQTGGAIGSMDFQELAPQFSEVLKGLSAGAVRVISTPEAVHVIRVNNVTGISRKVQLGVLTYRVDASDSTRNAAFDKAEKFAAAVSAEGFDKAVADQALAKRVATLASNDRALGGIASSREMVTWAFNGKQGDVSDVKEYGNTYVIAAIKGVFEKGIGSFEESKAYIRPYLVGEKKAALLKEKMAGATSLDVLAETLGTGIIEAAGINFQSFMAPETGFDPAFPGALAGLAQGALTKPIVGRIGVYLAQITQVADAEQSPELEKVRLEAEIQQNALQISYQALLDLSDITDERYRFY